MRRSTRTKVVRLALYALLVVAVAVVAFVTDWAKIRKQFFQWDIAKEQFPEIVTIAAKNTVIYTAIAFVCGITLGLILAMMKLSPVAPYRWIATVYIEIFRGLPALLTIFATAFVVPIAFGVSVPNAPVGAGIVGLIIVAGAYMAETIRAGIQSVPKGQVEAARSLGMSSTRTMVSVVLPQAVRIIIPPLTNEFVLLIKDTALLYIAGSTLTSKELTLFARGAAQQTANATPLVVTGLLYLAITIPLTRVVAWLERRQARAR
jgi:polar amino acid transport system permease protein